MSGFDFPLFQPTLPEAKLWTLASLLTFMQSPTVNTKSKSGATGPHSENR